MITLGLPDGVLGVAWPSISQTFRVSISSLGIMSVVFTSTYTAAGFASGWFLNRMTLGLLLASSGLVIGLGFLGYALAPSWWVLLVTTGIAGLGGGFLDSGLNLFAATRLSARVTNWIHSAFSLGGFAGAASDDVLLVQDVQLVKQTCTWSHVSFDDEAVADFSTGRSTPAVGPKLLPASGSIRIRATARSLA